MWYVVLNYQEGSWSPNGLGQGLGKSLVTVHGHKQEHSYDGLSTCVH